MKTNKDSIEKIKEKTVSMVHSKSKPLAVVIAAKVLYWSTNIAQML